MVSVNSTNVRITEAARRAQFAALQRVSTGLAARAATRLFLQTPPRTAKPDTAFAAGTRFTVPFGRERIAGWALGSGTRTALLVHGWGGRAGQMRAWIEPLRAAEYRVVAFDAPGHGASSGSELSLSRFAAAIQQVVNVVGPVQAVLAHSFGAAASAVAIADGLAIERAVFLGPPADELRWFERFSSHLGLEQRARLEAQHSIETEVGAPFAKFAAEALGPSLSLPLLVVHDRGDQEVPWEDGARFARAAAQGTLLTTESLGHRRILRDPQVIARAVAFLCGERPVWFENGGVKREECQRCGKALDEAWDSAGTLCLRCGLQRELADRESRWIQPSS